MKIIVDSSQVVTPSGGRQKGLALGSLSLIPQGEVAIEDGRIYAVGQKGELVGRFPGAERISAGGNAVVPGFVDPHTHLIFAGDRAVEFERRLQGKTYMEIMAAGGGILSTLKATRAASVEELVSQARERAHTAFRFGTTTMEAKTGYGLDIETELKMLEAIIQLNEEGPLEIVPTYMGAHAIPPEYAGNPDGYTRFLVETALPETRLWWQARVPGASLPFVDVFCEKDVFELAQTEAILTAAKALGFPLKLHADEFENLGGAALAARLGAFSADHLVKTSPADIQALADSETVAVSLPGTPFGLGQQEYSPARAIIAAGGCLALASDLNPGTTWNESMQFIQALACRAMKLTPAEALAASTINAAAALGMEDRLGSIEVGKQADLLILRVRDYRMLAYRYGTNLVSQVIKKGVVHPVG